MTEIWAIAQRIEDEYLPALLFAAASAKDLGHATPIGVPLFSSEEKAVAFTEFYGHETEIVPLDNAENIQYYLALCMNFWSKNMNAKDSDMNDTVHAFNKYVFTQIDPAKPIMADGEMMGPLAEVFMELFGDKVMSNFNFSVTELLPYKDYTILLGVSKKSVEEGGNQYFAIAKKGVYTTEEAFRAGGVEQPYISTTPNRERALEETKAWIDATYIDFG